MIEDDGVTVTGKRGDGSERFVECLTSNESPSEAISRAQARDPMGHPFLCREPEDQIAQRVRCIRLLPDLPLRI